MKPYRPNKRMFTEAETKDILCLFSTIVLSRQTLLALDELYRDASVFMDRKMMTYLRIKEEFDAKVWVKNYRLGGA